MYSDDDLARAIEYQKRRDTALEHEVYSLVERALAKAEERWPHGGEEYVREYLARIAPLRAHRSAARKIEIDFVLRREVFERDAYRCIECGDWHDLTLDHIQPESKGGPATFDNLRTLCRRCNSKKGSRA